MRYHSAAVCLLALLVVVGVFYPKRRPAVDVESEKRVVPPPVSEPAPASSLPPRPALPAEVQATLDRVFDQALVLDRAPSPAFLSGDFNGDEVADLAAVVRPRDEAAVGRLNAEMAPWSLQDAASPPIDTADVPEAVKVAIGDRLVAVVHGMGIEGWRSPDARQCYAVRNAGSLLRRQPLAEAPAAIRMKVYRPHVGDVIVGTVGGRPGLLFWTGARYVRADLKVDGAKEPVRG